MKIIYTLDVEKVCEEVEKSTRVSLDYETTGLDPKRGEILLIQVCPDTTKDVYVLLRQKANSSGLRKLMALLSERIVLCHTAVFEWQWTYTHFGVELNKIYDSMLCEKILHAGLKTFRADLASVALRTINVVLDKSLQKSFARVEEAREWEPSQEQIRYAALDAQHLHEIRAVQVRELVDQDLLQVAQLEFSVLPVFAKMELEGLCLDQEAHREVLKKYQKILDDEGAKARAILQPFWRQVELRELEEDTQEFLGLEQKVQKLLEPVGGRLSKDAPEDLRAEVETLRKCRNKNKPKQEQELSLTCRDKVLKALLESGVDLPNMQEGTIYEYLKEHPENQALQAYRKWIKAQKVVSTYGQNLVEQISPVTGRLHTSFNQIIATGRVSSAEPNLQNVPPDIRECFIPKVGHKFIIADYKGQELRVVACLSKDQAMLDCFRKNKDIHRITAQAAWPDLYKSWEDVPEESEHRKMGKGSNFAIAYGGDAYTLFRNRQVPDLETGKTLTEAISKAYPTMMRWLKREAERSLNRGFSLTAIGRKRFYPALPAKPDPENESATKHWKSLRNSLLREAMNAPIQGSSADVCKQAMILIDKELQPGEVICVVVHDEIVVQAPEHRAEEVKKIMERCMLQAALDMGITEIDVPAEISVASKWKK